MHEPKKNNKYMYLKESCLTNVKYTLVKETSRQKGSKTMYSFVKSVKYKKSLYLCIEGGFMNYGCWVLDKVFRLF